MSAANSSDLPASTFPAPDSAAPAALGEVQAPSNGQDIEMSDAISDGTVALNEAKAAVDADGKAVDIEEDVEPLDTEPTTSGLPHGMSKFNFIMLFVGLALAVFLAALDQTIIGIAIPQIVTEFQTVSGLSWIGIAYFLTSIAFIPTYGSFADVFSRKPVFLFAIGLFELGSLICALANSMIMLIVGRAIAGLGGGAIFSLVLIIIADIIPIEKRGAYAGIIGAMFGIASVAGPLLGGVFTEKLSWRFCFWINLPVGLVTVITVVFFMKLPPVVKEKGMMWKKFRAIDWIGTALLATGVSLLLVGLTSGGVDHPWDSAYVLSFLIVGFVIIVAFGVWNFKFAKNALLPKEFYQSRELLAAFFSSLMAGMLFFGLIYYSPLYFQVATGQTATEAGVSTIPLVMGVVVSNILSGGIASATGIAWPFIPVGAVLAAIGAGLVSTLNLDSGSGEKIGFLFLAGFGCGFTVQMILLVAQGSTSQEHVAAITANASFWQVLGAVLGIAFLGVIFVNQLTAKLIAFFPPGTSIDEFINQPTLISGLPEDVRVPVQQAYVETLSLMFKVSIGFAGAMLIGSLFMKKSKLGADAMKHGGGLA